MNKISILSRSVLALITLVAVAPAHAAWTLNMPRGVTDLTHTVFDLHMLIFWICVVIGIGVFGAMLISVIFHRKARGFEASHFHESAVVEIAWTVVPFLILIAVAIPSAGTLLQVEDSSNPDLTIRVTGHQWLWEYDYVDTGVHFFSRLDRKSDQARQPGSDIKPSDVPHYLRNVDKPMVVPVDEKVRLLLTSGDVIHAWWVPDLSGKKDAIPGYINDMWFKANKTGTYRGQCAELCGRGHAFMPIVVKVVSQDKYQQWIADNGGQANPQSKLAEGQPKGSQTNAEKQTVSKGSPVSGDAAKTRTNDSHTMKPQKAENDLVGQGEKHVGDAQGSSGQGADNPAKAGSGGTSDQSSDANNAQSDDGADQGANDGGSSSSERVEPGGTDQGTGDGDSSSSASGDANTQGAAGGSGGGATKASGGQQISKSELMSQGKQVYGNICVACHQPKGQGMPAAGFPALAGSAVATGPIPAHIKQVLNGKNAMPPYKDALSDPQIAAVVTYERNAFGNSTGDVVQPAQVAAQR